MIAYCEQDGLNRQLGGRIRDGPICHSRAIAINGSANQ